MALSTQYPLPIPKGLALLSMWFLGAQGPFTPGLQVHPLSWPGVSTEETALRVFQREGPWVEAFQQAAHQNQMCLNSQAARPHARLPTPGVPR